MVVVLNANVTVSAMPTMSWHNHSAFRTSLSFMLAEVVGRLGDDARIAERNYKVREWFSDADDCSDESKVDVFRGCKYQLDDKVTDYAKEEECR